MAAASSGSAIGVQARCTRLRAAWGSSPKLHALLEYLGGFGIVCDSSHRRPRQQEVSADGGIDVLGEAAHHSGHVLHAVPARDLHDHRRIGRRRRPGLEHVDAPVDAAR